MHSRLQRGLYVLVFSLAIAPAANAQIKRVDMILDAFLCGAKCEREVNHGLAPYKADLMQVSMNHAEKRVTLIPKEGKRINLYDFVKQLRSMDRVPIRTTVLVVGEVQDHAQALGTRQHVHIRKMLSVKKSDAKFVLSEGDELDKLLEFVSYGNKEVAVFGSIPAFDSKDYPILLIKKFKAKGDQWSDDEFKEDKLEKKQKKGEEKAGKK